MHLEKEQCDIFGSYFIKDDIGQAITANNELCRSLAINAFYIWFQQGAPQRSAIERY